MSKTVVTYNIIAALKEAEKILGPERKWEGVNDLQTRFINDFLNRGLNEVHAIREIEKIPIALLHCAINYPPPFEDLNLRAIKTLEKAFQVPVGYSDHTMSTNVPAICVALGACIIEKHYTINRNLKGPDHKFALEPNELKEMVKNIREAELSLGSSVKFKAKSEENLYKLARRSIIAKRKIPKGKKIESDDLTIKRPGYGIPPKFLDIIIGREAKENIDVDDIIKWDMI